MDNFELPQRAVRGTCVCVCVCVLEVNNGEFMEDFTD